MGGGVILPLFLSTAPKHSNAYMLMPLFRAVAYQNQTFSINSYPSMPLVRLLISDMFLLDLGDIVSIVALACASAASTAGLCAPFPLMVLSTP